MNIFFGKISQKFDIVQLKEGYYTAPKESSWFGELQLGDYVYMIGGDKVQFWQAKEWGIKNDKESLIFDVINPDLGINVSQLITLKFLKLTKALAVLTSRSARSKAFFKLEMLKDIPLRDLSNSQIYKNPELFRTIRIIKKEDVIENSEDIQLIYEDNKLHLFDNNFIANSIKKEFIDNLDKKGKGARMKDNVLEYFSNAVNNLPATITYKQIGLRSFYDAFFCEYKNSEKYFLVGAFLDTENPQDQTERFVKESIWSNGYSDKFNNEVNAVPVGSSIAIKLAFVREKTKAVMLIKARGIIIKNFKDGQNLEVQWEEDFNPFEVNFGGYMQTIKEVTKKDNIQAIWSDEQPKKEDNSIENKNLPNKMIGIPKNQILYGPPGTGKTFELQQIIEKWNLNETFKTSKDYTSFVKNYTWWEVIALVLYDKENITVPEIATNPLIISKLGSSNVKRLNTRLWSSLQNHTVDNCENVKLAKRIGEKVFYKELNSLWRLDNRKLFEEIYTPLIDAYNNFKNDDQIKSKDYTFTTCHQSLSYEDFIEGIKPVLTNDSNENDEEKEKSVSYEVRKGIFYNACEKAVQKAGFINLKDCLDKTKEDRKKGFDKAISENHIHVLFLDEINRCNVSGIFGELITLIEEDKRLGNKNEISDLILPYSQDEFGVPPNLYIIGTMNTADRSVEALDTALRRRFCFVEMMPNPEILENENFHDRVLIMEKINQRVELLLDRNYTLGHSYFIKQNFENSFKNEIIPLLQEYFYNDCGKIGLVLGKGFVREKEISKNKDISIFADFETKNDIDIIKSYELIPFNEIDFKSAIETLLI
ncbi:AAA family ATPase [Flavobacterium sp. MMLR14_040]|uniref:McrB family protein n=1 Tax=Flavobacterium sp. MMLR14_040 TaxID=3093843 RepID=UPI002990664B|nr:AAA family ATPase [Flavobacterium sp. MMLR14_040]MDW8852898.1 AAA family ATPase [Flavobacterium sp. MMLR14_040]